MLRLVYGRRSEKLTPDERAQLALAYGGSDEDAAKADPTAVVPKQGDQPVEEQAAASDTVKKKRPNRPRAHQAWRRPRRLCAASRHLVVAQLIERPSP